MSSDFIGDKVEKMGAADPQLQLDADIAADESLISSDALGWLIAAVRDLRARVALLEASAAGTEEGSTRKRSKS